MSVDLSGGVIPLSPAEPGYFTTVVSGIREGDRYWFVLRGGRRLADPASRWQPDGVHGPSAVASPRFDWTDYGWAGLPLRDYVIYELHTGTYTEEGTFQAAARDLDRLVDLGITAVELMPVAEFPGARNWGYDGVFPYAPSSAYGGPRGLRQFVDACHSRGLAVVLDVVYNHLGPEGNYLREFGPYFTAQYRTPWGDAMNFDGPHNREVRRYFLENALMWVRDYHIDALRLDAVHAIYDRSARPFLKELADAVHEFGRDSGRHVYLIAESDLNDDRILAPGREGGCEMDAQWSDDFHHSLHSLLTSETSGYYEDFGRVEHLARAFEHGWVYSGDWSPHRQRPHGNSPAGLEGQRFVVSAQNHDQVGNRMMGERLSALVGPEELKTAAAAVLLSPFIPMLFMGEEYGELAPFLYFVSHTEPELLEAVEQGRKAEFAAFRWAGTPPVPHAVETFERSKLQRHLRHRHPHSDLERWYRDLLTLRKTRPALRELSKAGTRVQFDEGTRTLVLTREGGGDQVCAVFHFGTGRRDLSPPPGNWTVLLESGGVRVFGAA